MRYTLTTIITAMAIILTGCNNENGQSKAPYLIHDKNTSKKTISKIEIKESLSGAKKIAQKEDSKKEVTEKEVTEKDRIEREKIEREEIEKKKAEASILETKITLANIEAKHKEKLASIVAEKEKAVKHIELEKTQIESKTRQNINTIEYKNKAIIEQARQKSQANIATQEAELHRQYFYGILFVLFALIILIYLIHRKNQTLKVKLHQDDIKHKMQMQESKQYHDRVNKTLEILADGNTDKNLKTDLIELLKDQNEKTPKLLK